MNNLTTWLMEEAGNNLTTWLMEAAGNNLTTWLMEEAGNTTSTPEATTKLLTASQIDFMTYYPVIKNIDRNKVILNKVISPIFLLLNLMSLVIFMRRGMRKKAVSSALIALSVADSFALTRPISEYLIPKYPTLHDIISIRLAYCMTITFITDTARGCSHCFVLVFTSERFISVMFPLKAKQICTPLRVKLVLLAIALIQVLLHISAFWKFYILKGNCVPVKELMNFFFIYDTIVQMGLSTILPFTLIAIMNICIIYQLVKQYQIRKKMSTQANIDDKAMITTTIMLVTVSTYSMLTYLPKITYFILHSAKVLYNVNNRFYSICILYVTDSIADFNYGMNFFFYILGGSQFRQEFIDLITCGTRRKRSQSATTVTTGMSSTFSTENGVKSNTSDANKLEMSRTP